MKDDLQGWERPRQEEQGDLFARETGYLLALAHVSHEDLARWKDLGWLSTEVATRDKMQEMEFDELVFVRNVARSGLSQTQIEGLLSELPKPYRYSPIRTVYHFALGWVQRPPAADRDEIDVFMEAHLEEWVRERAALAPHDALLDAVIGAIFEERARAPRRGREDENADD